MKILLVYSFLLVSDEEITYKKSINGEMVLVPKGYIK